MGKGEFPGKTEDVFLQCAQPSLRVHSRLCAILLPPGGSTLFSDFFLTSKRNGMAIAEGRGWGLHSLLVPGAVPHFLGERRGWKEGAGPGLQQEGDLGACVRSVLATAATGKVAFVGRPR